MTDAKKTARFIIHGRVQGVFFRDTASKLREDLILKALPPICWTEPLK